MTEPVGYISFGGAQVPEGTRREIIDRTKANYKGEGTYRQ